LLSISSISSFRSASSLTLSLCTVCLIPRQGDLSVELSGSSSRSFLQLFPDQELQDASSCTVLKLRLALLDDGNLRPHFDVFDSTLPLSDYSAFRVRTQE
jgi:hypothetical protein